MSETFDEIIMGDTFHNPTTDQDMLDVIDHARDVEWQLNMSDPTSDDIKRHVMVLDSEWNKWLNSTVTASGMVYCTPKNDTKIAPILKEAQVISKGFDIYSLPGEDDTPTQYIVVLALLVRPQDVLSSEEIADSIYATRSDEGDVYIPAYALLDEIVIESNEMTTIKAFDYITTFYPELEKEIDRRIGNSRNSLQALLALQGIDIASFADCNNKMTRYAVIMYLKALISIDHDFPHELAFGEGTIYATSSDERDTLSPIETRDGDKVHAQVSSFIHFVEIHEDEDEVSDAWTLAIDVTPIAEDHRERRRHFCVPIDALASIQSMRKMLK